MRILVIGSGAREHALAWKLATSTTATEVLCAPGNPGMESIARCLPVKASDLGGLAEVAIRERIDLTVVGPEQPLADGIVDAFTAKGLRIFGPSRAASRLEWSKAFAKEFMARHGIPTSASVTFRSDEGDAARRYIRTCPLPVVIKADGLAAGKGVIICATRAEAESGITQMFDARVFGTAGSAVVIEEFMTGTEASVFAVADGEHYCLLAPAQDHKRAFDDDRGKNTGGMGAFAPTPFVSEPLLRTVEESIVRPTLRGMAEDGHPYRGCLYVGLMLTAHGPKVVEYNCRFGDPETQVVLPLYAGDFAELLAGAADGRIVTSRPAPSVRGSAVCVVLASEGYPDSYPTGREIRGLDAVGGLQDIVVFHAGTKREGGRLVTAGGRVLGVTAVAPAQTIERAIGRVYEAVGMISFEGMHYRRDIGRRAVREARGGVIHPPKG